MATDTKALTQQSIYLYDHYVKPLEADHLGEYIAVSETGKFVLAPTLFEVMDEADKELPSGSFLYRVGDLCLDKWR